MKQRIDLHLHTNQSDGTYSPAELLEVVRNLDLVAFAVTDHDTLKGYLEIRELRRNGDSELIPGVEFSCSSSAKDIHILAYLFDTDNEPLHRAIEQFQEGRNKRGAQIVKRLNELGVEITFEEVLKEAGGAPVGRPHVAAALHARKAVSTYEHAFHKYIGDGRPAFVPKKNFAPREAIKLVHQARGVAVLAHPMVDNSVALVEDLVALGLDGIEVYHPSHRQADVDRLKHLAERLRLLCSGGSDFHGRGANHGTVGSEPVPVEYLDKLKERAAKKRESN